MKNQISQYKNTPITFQYKAPSQSLLDSIKDQSGPVELSQNQRIQVDCRYFKKGIKGSHPKIFLREKLRNAMNEALSLLDPSYGFVVFDGYRSRETQEGLFSSYSDEIKSKNPSFTKEELYLETRKYVAHPDEPSRFEVPPHLSGGAVDIGLTFKGKPLNMGTDFDDLTDKASTDYFEKKYETSLGERETEWVAIRENRRILFHSLKAVGFTNWKFEWWHYDMGNCVWAQELGQNWIYDKMEIKDE